MSSEEKKKVTLPLLEQEEDAELELITDEVGDAVLRFVGPSGGNILDIRYGKLHFRDDIHPKFKKYIRLDETGKIAIGDCCK